MRTRVRSALRVMKEISKALLFFLLFVVVIPILIGVMQNIPPGNILSFIASTFLLQAAAPPLGGPLGLSRYVVLAIMASFAAGMVLVILEVCESLALTSDRVSRWIENIGKKMEKYPVIQKYGAVSCILIAWIPGIGLYGTPIIAWILGWNRWLTVAFTTIGFVIAALFVQFVALNIHNVQDIVILAVIGAVIGIILVLFGKFVHKRAG